MNSPLRKSEIIRQLELRIVGGEFAAGQKLPSERELAEEYGVGRPVIREGLSGLVASGLVDIQVGRGTFVRGISVDVLSKSLNRVAARTGITTRHLVEARLMIEVAAARHAAMASQGAIQELEEVLIRHEEAQSMVDRASTDLQFHEAIAANELKKARQLNDRLFPLHYAMFSDASPAPVKYALSRVHDWIEPEVRLPLVESSPEAKKAVDEALVLAGVLPA